MSLLDRLQSLVTGIADVASEYKELHRKLAVARDRRKFLLTAPRPRACMLAALDRTLDEYRLHFDDKVRQLVTQLQDTPCDQPHALQPGGYDLLARLTERHALTYLLGTTLRTEIRRAVGEMPWPESGPAAGPRATELARVDREIAEIEAAIAEARDRANQAGIALEA